MLIDLPETNRDIIQEQLTASLSTRQIKKKQFHVELPEKSNKGKITMLLILPHKQQQFLEIWLLLPLCYPHSYLDATAMQAFCMRA